VEGRSCADPVWVATLGQEGQSLSKEVSLTPVLVTSGVFKCSLLSADVAPQFETPEQRGTCPGPASAHRLQ